MLSVPQIIGNIYQISAQIGAGGMGLVYQGIDLQTGNAVAIKRMRPEIVGDNEVIKRFTREAELLRQLNHPNIVKVLATVQEANEYYIVMEYIAGGSLQDRLKTLVPLSLTEVLKISIELVDALTRAHYLHIIHRDLKPANVLLAEDGTPRLVDFGVAAVKNAERLTRSGEPLGTLDYLSPEVLDGKKIDARTDIWSFGVMLFEMISGKRPFGDGAVGSLLSAILLHPTPDLEALAPDAPVALIDLVYRMLEKDRERRIPSMRLVGAELEGVMNVTDLSFKPITRTTNHYTTSSISLTMGLQRHNLPTQPTAFIGRESELAELAKLLENPEVRMVTILAAGGMGKTRLALEAARQQLMQFSNGVYLVQLAALTTADAIIPEIANAVGYKFQQDGTSLEKQLFDYLQNREMLLVLDNFEHLLDGADTVNSMLQATQEIKVLVSSREKLNLSAEIIFQLGGMEFPDRDTMTNIFEYGAVKLFMQSARRVKPDVEFAAKDVWYIVRICRIVQGMPLAIVLAAAWVEMLSLPEILEELMHSIDLLETDLRDVPERQRSIRAVFDYSWSKLGDEDRRSFMKLAVFRSGFTRDAAQTVVGVSLRTLQIFVNKSLLMRSPAGRYEVHELLRQYAEEKLKPSGEATETRSTHSDYYLNMLHQREADIKGRLQLPTLDDIEADFENVRLAWSHALERGNEAAINNALETLSWFCIMRTRYQESEELFTQVEDRLKSRTDSLALLIKARILLRRLRIQRWREGSLNRYKNVRAEVEQLLALAREQGDPDEIYACLFVLADVVYTVDGDPQRAFALFEECLTYYRQSQEPFHEAWVLHFMANYSLPTAGLSRALELQHQLLNLRREIGDQIGVVYSLYNLSSTLLLAADIQQCETFALEMRGRSREIGERSGELMAGITLSQIAFLHGKFEQAAELARQNMELATDINHMLGKSYALSLLGVIACLRDNYRSGQQSLSDSIGMTQQSTARFQVDWGMALAACGLGDYATARQHHHKALRFALRVRAPGPMAWCLPTAVLLALEAGEDERAVELLGLVFSRPGHMNGWLEEWVLIEEIQAQLNARLGSSAFQAAWEHGENLDLEAVIEELFAEEAGPTAEASTPSTPMQFPARILEANAALVEPLSERELEVLGLIAAGLSNQDIADKLVVGISTVKKHITHIYDKLTVTSRTQAVLRAQELNLV